MNTVILWNGNDRKKGGSMKQWEVIHNYVGGELICQVVRIRDTREVRHAGNFDFDGGLFDTLAEAQAHANELNAHARLEVIRQALTALGYYGNVQFIAVELDDSRAQVIMNNEVFGIYDFSKQTFVD